MGVIGQPVPRVDGPAKVAGKATYAAEFHPEGLAYAATVRATVPHGRVASFDTTGAEALPGVIAVLTHENAPRLPWQPVEQAPVDPGGGEQLKPLQSDRILFAGQPIALVVAESQEAARDAASRVRFTCIAEAGAGLIFDPARARPPSEGTQESYPAEWERGDTEGALAASAVQVEGDYLQPRLYHNAMEPHATIAAWDTDGGLTLWDKSQWVDNFRDQIARNFGLDENEVRVISPFVGGAFGAALRCWPHVTLAAMAAKVVERPVRLELTRRELYTSIGFRPQTLQNVRLGADGDGRLRGIVQTAWGLTSAYEDYGEEVLDPTGMLYDAESAKTVYRLVEVDTNTPTPMRGPGAVTGVFAMEMAIDELADAAGIDPLEFRLRNYAERDRKKDLPFSSKALRDCYATAARRFGWEKRNPERRSMRADGMLVGYGMASAVWPAMRSPASVRVRLFANGTAVVRTAASDMGPGTYTSMTQVAAEMLDLPMERVTFELGDSTLPMAPVHGGSMTMASVGSAVAAGCTRLCQEIGRLGDAKDGEHPVETLKRLRRDSFEVEGKAEPGKEAETHSSYAFGAVFAEVRVDPDLGTVRVSRLVGAYDGGVIVNPRTARSQAIGGMVQGIGMALMEAGEWDERLGRVMNANLAEYLVPVHADIEELDAVFVESEDRILNPLGVKGIAEIALCGVAPAIANAVWHATGLRIRELPLTPDRLLMAEEWAEGMPA